MWHNTFKAEPYSARSLYFWEPLNVDAPPDARPHCCYIRTVIFYASHDWQRGVVTKLAECESAWDLLGQRWTEEHIGWAALAPFVEHEGSVYELASAQVVYKDGRWWKRWLAWRVPADDARLTLATEHPAA